MVLEKTLESHLDCKEIQPVHPKGNRHGGSHAGPELSVGSRLISESGLCRIGRKWKEEVSASSWRKEEALGLMKKPSRRRR